MDIRENADISEKYDEFVLEWMADIYTYMQWKYEMDSCKIVRAVSPKELYEKYSPLHEAGIESGLEKLRAIYQL